MVARQATLLDHYVGTVEIEVNTMIDLMNQHVIPSVKRAGVGPLRDIVQGVETLQAGLKQVHGADGVRKAQVARALRLETMVKVREAVDAAEAVVPADLWTLATYKDLLFLDATS
eukprot:gene39634-52925_t